jgi:hypothetical protein
MSDKHMKKRKSFQQGNALIEFFVFGIVATPALIMIPVLYSQNVSNHSANQALRYGAWEQTVGRKSAEELSKEVKQRFIAPKKAELVHYGVNESGLGGAAGTVEKIVSTLGKSIGAAIPDSEWGLGGGGVITVSLSSSLIKEKDEADKSALEEDCTEENPCTTGKSAILVDTWGSSGPQQVERRVRSLVPAGALKPVGDIVSNVGKALPVFQELEYLDGAFGSVKPDVLPEGRYSDE